MIQGGGVYILPIGHVVCQHFRFSSSAHSELIHGDTSAGWIERCIVFLNFILSIEMLDSQRWPCHSYPLSNRQRPNRGE
jgi:hypothetical protein